MSLKPGGPRAVPADTARVARAAFPKGHPYLKVREELGELFSDAQFASLFSCTGQPAAAPGCLALVTRLQFAEHLSDREAADAVRSRLDWKYLLGLELTDAGFHHSVLCEFRTRLVHHDGAHLLFKALLERCRERGLVQAGGKQRTDSTQVLAGVRHLNRLELVRETLRTALNALAVAAPEWLAPALDPAWERRYAAGLAQPAPPGRRRSAGRRPSSMAGMGSVSWKGCMARAARPGCGSFRPSKRCGRSGCSSIPALCP